ncbi:unnamed protein product [Symbiodinium pilosum]|uniref:Class I SAM-dependent methyltransferase n=1 Tax=Symbiodinium pilosum TaxID=2952 RepID=A0A812Q4C8_SYMPI|nr:unnamed protein product [Symbiodinium pilosum]
MEVLRTFWPRQPPEESDADINSLNGANCGSGKAQEAKVLQQHADEIQEIRGRPMYLEFGVFEGTSINFIARQLRSLDPGSLVFGFDSFRGLPEAWRNNSDVPGGLTFGQSSFALEKEPEVESNVRLVRAAGMVLAS